MSPSYPMSKFPLSATKERPRLSKYCFAVFHAVLTKCYFPAHLKDPRVFVQVLKTILASAQPSETVVSDLAEYLMSSLR